MYDYGKICSDRLRSCIQEIEECPSQEEFIISQYADYVNHMVNDSVNLAFASMLIECYNFNFDKILSNIMKLIVAGKSNICMQEPNMSDIIGGITFALDSDLSGLLNSIKEIKKKDTDLDDLPFH